MGAGRLIERLPGRASLAADMINKRNGNRQMLSGRLDFEGGYRFGVSVGNQ